MAMFCPLGSVSLAPKQYMSARQLWLASLQCENCMPVGCPFAFSWPPALRRSSHVLGGDVMAPHEHPQTRALDLRRRLPGVEHREQMAAGGAGNGALEQAPAADAGRVGFDGASVTHRGNLLRAGDSTVWDASERVNLFIRLRPRLSSGISCHDP